MAQSEDFKRFGTMTADLVELRGWLAETTGHPRSDGITGCTGNRCTTYSKGLCEVCLVNAQHIKHVPGRKTDMKDAEWIATLLQRGLFSRASSLLVSSESCAT